MKRMNPLSGVLSEAWELYKRHAAHFLLISFVIYVVVAAVSALLTATLGGFGSFLGEIISVFGMFLLQAALVKAVQDVRDGRADLSVGETVSAVTPVLGAVALASILASIAITIGFFLLIVPGLILVTYLSLIVPWVVIGQTRALDAFGKSWRTVSGYGWQVFGTYVVTFLVLVVAEIVLSLILLALPGVLRSFISSVVAGTLVAPFIAAVVTLIYYRLTAAHGEPGEPGEPGAGPWPGTPSDQESPWNS
jgi:hypothetical protein